MMDWNGDGMNGWGFGLMTVGMLLFWGLLVFGAVVVARRLGHMSRRHPAAPPTAPPTDRFPPEQLLAERLARGEIDADEYRHRLEVLRTGTGKSSN
ncbi:SHOCT domain-containing protein [Kitasatospora sp. RB6PN24]|uniref:SHOCT domain-containing protein n=1 Tax=Kitasatospora humi TaxID=2893891 RepID=UPI001E3E548B|nr:SHOCT domain-containing protein [Kitasatospora humi]MCC9306098.1 SHOCT domain-containing protein [Kitasatospora humi]